MAKENLPIIPNTDLGKKWEDEEEIIDITEKNDFAYEISYYSDIKYSEIKHAIDELGDLTQPQTDIKKLKSFFKLYKIDDVRITKNTSGDEIVWKLKTDNSGNICLEWKGFLKVKCRSTEKNSTLKFKGLDSGNSSLQKVFTIDPDERGSYMDITTNSFRYSDSNYRYLYINEISKGMWLDDMFNWPYQDGTLTYITEKAPMPIFVCEKPEGGWGTAHKFVYKKGYSFWGEVKQVSLKNFRSKTGRYVSGWQNVNKVNTASESSVGFRDKNEGNLATKFFNKETRILVASNLYDREYDNVYVNAYNDVYKKVNNNSELIFSSSHENGNEYDLFLYYIPPLSEELKVDKCSAKYGTSDMLDVYDPDKDKVREDWVSYREVSFDMSNDTIAEYAKPKTYICDCDGGEFELLGTRWREYSNTDERYFSWDSFVSLKSMTLEYTAPSYYPEIKKLLKTEGQAITRAQYGNALTEHTSQGIRAINFTCKIFLENIPCFKYSNEKQNTTFGLYYYDKNYGSQELDSKYSDVYWRDGDYTTAKAPTLDLSTQSILRTASTIKCDYGITKEAFIRTPGTMDDKYHLQCNFKDAPNIGFFILVARIKQ